MVVGGAVDVGETVGCGTVDGDGIVDGWPVDICGTVGDWALDGVGIVDCWTVDGCGTVSDWAVVVFNQFHHYHIRYTRIKDKLDLYQYREWNNVER